MNYSHFIFDLDGTLVDSASEIHEAATVVCRKHGLLIPSLNYIRNMTGSPPSLFFLDHGCAESDSKLLVAEFRSYLKANAGDPGCVFPAVTSLLEHLRQQETRISLATTKPTELASSLIERYGLSQYFEHIQGTDPPMRHKPQPDILNACLELAPHGYAVMVGDTVYDVEAAHNAGIDSIAVCSGAHSVDRLTEACPTFLFESLQDIQAAFKLLPCQ